MDTSDSIEELNISDPIVTRVIRWMLHVVYNIILHEENVDNIDIDDHQNLSATVTSIISQAHLANRSSDGSNGATQSVNVDETNLFNQTIIIIGHGESAEIAIPSWHRLSFSFGKYHPCDLNLPMRIPNRPIIDYIHDSPLTEIGRIQGQLIGRGIKLARLNRSIRRIISAPELRCIETAKAIIGRLKIANCLICIDAAFAERQRKHFNTPHWFTLNELLKLSMPIDVNYRPILVRDRLESNESLSTYKDRVTNAIENLRRDQFKSETVIAIVGHCSTVRVSRFDHSDPIIKIKANSFCDVSIKQWSKTTGEQIFDIDPSLIIALKIHS